MRCRSDRLRRFAAIDTGIIDAEYPATRCVLQNSVILMQIDAEKLGNFNVAGITPFIVLYFSYRLGDLSGLAVHRTWRPVSTADLVQHGTAYTDTRVGLETGAL